MELEMCEKTQRFLHKCWKVINTKFSYVAYVGTSITSIVECEFLVYKITYDDLWLGLKEILKKKGNGGM